MLLHRVFGFLCSASYVIDQASISFSDSELGLQAMSLLSSVSSMSTSVAEPPSVMGSCCSMVSAFLSFLLFFLSFFQPVA